MAIQRGRRRGNGHQHPAANSMTYTPTVAHWDGYLRVIETATDSDGLMAQAASDWLWVDHQAPTVTIDGAAIAAVATPMVLTAQGSDDGAPQAALTYAWERIAGPDVVTFGSAGTRAPRSHLVPLGSTPLACVRMTANSLQALNIKSWLPLTELSRQSPSAHDGLRCEGVAILTPSV